MVYASAKAGRASLIEPVGGTLPDSPDLGPLFATILEHIPAPIYTEGATLQAHVTNLDASPYLAGLRCADRRRHPAPEPDGGVVPRRRHRTQRQTVRAVDHQGPRPRAGRNRLARVTSSPSPAFRTSPSARRLDPDNPKPLPLITVDEPSISMTIGINTSPMAGRSGKNPTARLVKGRLDAELVGNVSIRVLPTERPDTWEVQGRGELQLAVLVEMMRREGFEPTVGKPQVVTREINGHVHEPVERLTVDIPEDFVGVVTSSWVFGTVGRSRWSTTAPAGFGWSTCAGPRADRLPTEFLTETRGTGLMHHVFDGYEPAGDLRTRATGSLVADRTDWSPRTRCTTCRSA